MNWPEAIIGDQNISEWIISIYQSSIIIIIHKLGGVWVGCKLASVPWDLQKAHNLEDIMDYNQDRWSVAET